MDRLITNAWRAFWVGLGASAVLVAQAVIAPTQPAAPTEPVTAPAMEGLKLGPLARPLHDTVHPDAPSISQTPVARTKKPGA